MKILMLHGWNSDNYTNQTDSKDAWENRKEFVKELEKKHEIYKINFPGFCGEKEPKKAWNLEDFAKYVKDYLDKNELKVDYILGYSFGGAVATTYNRLYDNDQKLILVSPALTRNKTKSKKFIRTPKIFDPIRIGLRNLYLKYIVKNKYMIKGTKFLNATYQNIVRVELIDEILKTDPNKLTIIYGEEDNMVNPNLVISTLSNKYKDSIKIIKKGGHDIANTNTKELVKIINDIK